MNELYAAAMVIGAGVIAWFANRILRSTPPSEATMREIADELKEVAERLAAAEAKLESRSVDRLWQEHNALTKDVGNVARDVAEHEGVISQLSPLVSRLDAYLRTVQGGGG